ncbi:T6SS immunity protein Tli4 family protein [Erwinia sp. Leaf53]|uniref:T6SS immunity protein Tli4 family protein n=1 Tax=Erwinia sp. Leaf53 TaxID=1736225 RepID=UPI0012E2F639|nr:T6SS immunity protein Tli4 family protein [Erwinia sp. Leaf53]
MSILSGLHPRKDNQRPEGNSLAIKYAQVDASLLGEYETSMHYKSTQDITINLSTNKNSDSDTLLLEQDDRAVEGVYGSTIYQGKRVVNGLDVSEWLIREKQTPEGIPVTEYRFTLKAHEIKTGSSSSLVLSMIYSTRDKDPQVILSEPELIAVWKMVTNTLKYHKAW